MHKKYDDVEMGKCWLLPAIGYDNVDGAELGLGASCSRIHNFVTA
jgi:hypothetical protein